MARLGGGHGFIVAEKIGASTLVAGLFIHVAQLYLFKHVFGSFPLYSRRLARQELRYRVAGGLSVRAIR
jgi:hypothetical protein